MHKYLVAQRFFYHILGLTICLACYPKDIVAQATKDLIIGYKLGEEVDPSHLLSDREIIEAESIFKDLNLWRVTVRAAPAKSSVKARLLQNNKVRYIHESLVAHNRRIPNDPDYPSQWSLPQIGMPDVWDITTGGKNPAGHDIVVGILDDGYQLDHPDLESSIWINQGEIEDNGLDDDGNGFIDDVYGWNARARDDNHLINNHGTSVAGIIGATSDNDNQMAGINWDVKLMLTSSGSNNGYALPDIVKSYEYIYEQRKLYNNTQGEQGAYVVATNYSGGVSNRFPEDFPSWCEIYDALGSIGIVNIGSTANANTNVEMEGDLPSTCTSEFLIVTTNTGRINQKVENAGFGNVSVDLGAPGDDIYTLARNSGIDQAFFGTSAAAPHVAGVVSLLYSLICEEAYLQSLSDPPSMANIMKSAILDHVAPSATLSDITVTGGVLDALASIEVINQTIGDCCEITISEIAITDESCTDADDGIATITASGVDLRGDLLYSLAGSGAEFGNSSGDFTRLPSTSYILTIIDEDNPLCMVDSTFIIGDATTPCPFGDFEIKNVRNDLEGGIIVIDYELNEQKDIRIQIHDNAGRLIYTTLIRPALNEGRSHEVNTTNFPEGIYHASILANGLRDVASFIVIH